MKDKGGRPTVMTEEVLSKLEEAFSYGATDIEACFRAGISKDSLYRYIEKNPEFSERKEALKDMPKYQSKVNIVEAIRDGDKQQSNWYLERRDKEHFSTRQETTGKNGEPLSATINIIKPDGDQLQAE